MTKYIIETNYNEDNGGGYYYTDKDMNFVQTNKEQAYEFTVQELIELELNKHYKYDTLEIIEVQNG